MAQTSEFGAFIRHDPANFDAESAVDCVSYKDVVANNLNHLADQRGQVLVNAHLISGNELTTEDPAVSGNTNYWFPMTIFGPFFLTCRGDGTPYPLVVRIAGFAGAANEVRFRVIVSAPGDATSFFYDASSSWDDDFQNTLTAATSSTSTGWLTTTGVGGSSTNLIELSQSMASVEMTRLISTPDATSGGKFAQRPAVMAAITVVAGTTNTAARPYLTALEVREYVGGP